MHTEKTETTLFYLIRDEKQTARVRS